MRTEKLVRAAVVVSVLGCVVSALSLKLGVKDAPPLAELVGRFHILALHVPIGVLVMALAGEACTFFRRGRRMGDVVVGFALPLLVISGFAAVVLGLLLAHGGHYPHKLVSAHRNFTILGLCFAGVARLLWTRRRKRWLHRGLLGAAAISMTIGAHFGGSMTHGADYLTELLGAPKTPPIVDEEEDAGATPVVTSEDAGHVVEAGAPDAAMETAADVDAGSIDAGPVDAGPPKPTHKQLAQAIVNRKCSPCHTTNQKGGLRMKDVSKPGKRGVLVPGNPEASSLYTRLVLPMDDDDHMPPEDEAQLTKGEIAIIRAFITESK